jgi:hypothetical protein
MKKDAFKASKCLRLYRLHFFQGKARRTTAIMSTTSFCNSIKSDRLDGFHEKAILWDII